MIADLTIIFGLTCFSLIQHFYELKEIKRQYNDQVDRIINAHRTIDVKAIVREVRK